MDRRKATVVIGVIFLALAPQSADAARRRYSGRVASDLGGFLRITAMVRSVTADTFVGTLRCRNGPSLRCLSKRGGVTLTFTPGGFEAVLSFVNGVQCVAVGSGTPFSALVGEYACQLGSQVVDSGVLQLRRRR